MGGLPVRFMSMLAPLMAASLLAAGCGPSRTPNGAPSPTATGSVTPTPSTGATATTETTSFAATAPWPSLAFVRRWSGLSEPLYLTTADSDAGRVFIVEKGGLVRTATGDSVDARPFLDVSGKVSTGAEQGLLSIAFPPGAASAERFYAYYTATNGDVVISRFSRRGAAADPGSERELLHIPHSTYPNHNGGLLMFGPDGMLYTGIGDGGSGGDPNGNGQNLGVLLGKLLRIDAEGVGAGGRVPRTYASPADNPFAGRAGARPEIWAYGLRNPWRFSFDAATRDLYIGDVGQNEWEEIDFQPAGSRGGEDYGWSIMEGTHRFKRGSAEGLTPPVAEYGHDLGYSVTGGYVYRGSRYPALRGVYFFADYGSGRVWGLRRAGGRWQTRELARTSYGIASFGQDPDRELYLLDLNGGAVYQLTAK